MSREYKDSGIEWIGQIPKEWKICRLKSLSKIERGGSPRPIEDYISDTGYNWIKIGDTIKGNKYISTVRQKIDESGLSKTRLVHKGDLILTNSMSYGEPYILNVDGCIHDGWVAISELKIIDKEYLYYSLSSSVCKIQFGLQVAGGVVNNLNVDKIGTTLIVVPPFSEQQKIADYLDKICGEADEMIALQEKMIEELKAYKQSVITEAVTKGLNPNVPMKDSGIDWIGEIPEHWKNITLKHIITKIESGVSVNAELIQAENDEFGVLKTSSVSSNYFIPSENKRVDIEEYNRVSCPVKADTIIVSRMNTPELVGAAGYCSQDIPTIFLPDRLWQVHFDKSKLFVKFGWYYLISSPIKAYYSSLSSGTSSSMQNISQPQFCKAFFLLPPIPEQQSIASYLESKCSDIDALIAVKQQKIEELKSYKKSIIYEYVTGKKEVV